MLNYFENKTAFALTIIFTICALILWVLCLIENSVNSITAPIILFVQTFVIVSAVLGLMICWGVFFCQGWRHSHQGSDCFKRSLIRKRVCIEVG